MESLESPLASHLRLELKPLSTEAVELWLRKSLPIQTDFEEFLKLAPRYRGNPFAIREAIRRGNAPLEAPPQGRDLSSFHREYLNFLEPPQRQLLKVIALFGRPMPRDLLSDAFELPLIRFEPAIQALLEQGTLNENGGLIFFQHGSFQRWLVEHLELAESQRLHGKLAEILGHRENESAETIASHWLGSETPAKGIPYCLQAARNLARAHEYRQALSFYQAILDLQDRGDRKLRQSVVEEIASTCAMAGKPRQGAELLQGLPVTGMTSKEKGRRLGNLGILLHRAGEIQQAAAHLEKGLRCLPASFSVPWFCERLRFESELAEISSNLGEYDKAKHICIKALERLAKLEKSKKDPEILRQEMVLLETLAHLHLRQFEYREARSLFDQSLQIGKQLGAGREKSLILNNLGSLHLQENRFRQAGECFEQAARLAAELGDDQNAAVIQGNLAVNYAKMGEPEMADASLATAARLDARCDSKRSRYLRWRCSGMVDMHFSRYGTAIETFEKSIDLGIELKDHFLVAFDWIFLGECHLFRGELKAAWSALERALAMGVSSPEPVRSMVHARMAVVAASRNEVAKANEFLSKKPEKLPERFLFLESWNSIFRGWARRLLDSGESAREELEAARHFFKGAGAPGGEIHALLELAAIDMDRGNFSSAGRRLSGLLKQHSPGHGVLKNSLLSARALAFQARLAIEKPQADFATAHSLLLEAESFLIGHRFREVEHLVRDLKRRLHLSRLPIRQGNLFIPPGASRESEAAILEVVDSFKEEMKELIRQVGEETGGERIEPLSRHLRELEEKLRQSRRTIEGKPPSGPEACRADSILGRSEAIANIRATILKFAATTLPILIQGETGTGKELVARAIHGESARRQGPFIAVNCSSLPEEILEAELFGYLQGAFSGAEGDRRGLLVEAHGGSFFFDEIGELPLTLQGKLLRVLERHAVRPLGGSAEVPIDARYLFSTNGNLGDMVKSGKIRSDLYFRLGALEITVPPLRERLEDIPELARHFYSRIAGDGQAPLFQANALQALASYSWPGNVRELQNVVTRLSLLSQSAVSDGEVRSLIGNSSDVGMFSTALLRSRPLEQLQAQLENEYLTRLYFDRGGDLKDMAKILGITLRALYERFKRLEIQLQRLKKSR